LGQKIIPFLRRSGFDFQEEEKTICWIGAAARVLSNYNYLLAEIAEDFKQFTSLAWSPEIRHFFAETASARKVVEILLREIKQEDSPIPFSRVQEITKKIQTEEGIKGKELYHPIRLALTGKESGIELKDFIPLIEAGALLPFKPGVMNMVSRLQGLL